MNHAAGAKVGRDRQRKAASDRLHPHRRAIGQHFGDPVHDLVGVVAHADDGVGAALLPMLAHQVEGLLPGGFRQMHIGGDLPAEDRLDIAQ